MKHQLVLRENGTHQILNRIYFKDRKGEEAKARKQFWQRYDFSHVYMRVEK